MRKSNTSSSAWLQQTMFITFSDSIEHKLLNAKIENVVSIKSKQINSVANEYEKVETE